MEPSAKTANYCKALNSTFGTILFLFSNGTTHTPRRAQQCANPCLIPLSSKCYCCCNAVGFLALENANCYQVTANWARPSTIRNNFSMFSFQRDYSARNENAMGLQKCGRQELFGTDFAMLYIARSATPIAVQFYQTHHQHQTTCVYCMSHALTSLAPV